MIVDAALGQVIPDATLPQNSQVRVDLPGGLLIEGGTPRGANLFHSFQEFGVPTGTRVQFNNSEAIANIFSRVTGSQASQIDGILAANGQANLFLLNPRGIAIGANAQLNLGGALLLSTADRVVFSDRLEFSATNPQPLLSVNVPLGLQFNQAQAITVRGKGRTDPDLDRRFLPVVLNPGGLHHGGAIAIIGGKLDLQGALVYGTEVELGAVQQGLVSFDLANWQFDHQGVSQRGSVQIDQASVISGGKINLSGGDLQVLAGSLIVAQNQTDTSAPGIKINSDQLTISGVQPGTSFNVSGIVAEGVSSAKAGDIEVKANNLLVTEGGNLINRGFNLAAGGNIDLDIKEQIQVSGAVPNNQVAVSAVGTLTLGRAAGGDLTGTTDRLVVADGANLNASTFSLGKGGDLRLSAGQSVTVTGVNSFLPSAIVANSFSQGNGGNLEITSPNLRVLGGARVSAATGAAGNAGNLTINASQSIQVQGNATNFFNPSQIDSSANIVDQVTQTALGLPPVPSGNAGSVKINTPQLGLSDRGSLSVRNDGSGNPGTLAINSEQIQLRSDASITAVSNQGTGGQIKIDTQNLSLNSAAIVSASLQSGRGADIQITATGNLDLVGAGLDRLVSELFPIVLLGGGRNLLERPLNFGILTSSFGAGNAGKLTIAANNLSLANGAFVTTATIGAGNAGDLDLEVKNTIRLDDSLISTNTTSSGNGGNLQVRAAKIYGINAGELTSSTVGSGRAGDITISVTELLDFEGGRLGIPIPGLPNVPLNLRAGLAATSALSTGSSGNVSVIAPVINLRDQAAIATSAFSFATGGDIKIMADRINLSKSGRISGQSVAGDGGNVQIKATEAVIARNGQIFASSGVESFGGGDGGNIQISSPVLVLLDQAEINANAFTGAGGNIDIATQSLLVDQLSKVTASSNLGVDGQIQINSPDLDSTSGLVQLPDRLIDLSNLINLGCGSRGNFVYTGRRGLPLNAAESWRLSILGIPQVKPIREATSWYRLGNGQISLVSAAESTWRQFQAPICSSSGLIPIR
ncbi:MAG: filamentous hemagglutinin N-terminal domain-containing protein [Pseudanabaenaceae cyanobacterium bins.68]|nr:filamentous hemagglutinin N-terminal domain-containing protein [Pseudanabaenaceae cyanobacterium bins.68]